MMLRTIDGKRRREWQEVRWLDSITDSMDMNLRKLGDKKRTEEPDMLQFMGWERVRHDSVTQKQQQKVTKKEREKRCCSGQLSISEDPSLACRPLGTSYRMFFIL